MLYGFSGVLGSLQMTISFFKRAKVGLKCRGFFVLKENIARSRICVGQRK